MADITRIFTWAQSKTSDEFYSCEEIKGEVFQLVGWAGRIEGYGVRGKSPEEVVAKLEDLFLGSAKKKWDLNSQIIEKYEAFYGKKEKSKWLTFKEFFIGLKATILKKMMGMITITHAKK